MKDNRGKEMYYQEPPLSTTTGEIHARKWTTWIARRMRGECACTVFSVTKSAEKGIEPDRYWCDHHDGNKIRLRSVDIKQNSRKLTAIEFKVLFPNAIWKESFVEEEK